MAVYTQLGAEVLGAIIARFDVGVLVSAKGIAEGVSNSNWLIETEGAGRKSGRFILTMYEERTEVSDLPFFLGLLDHLAGRGCPVPRTIHDRANRSFHMHEGKALALIEFLPGVSVSAPEPAQARAVGSALAAVHLAARNFPGRRANAMGMAKWRELLDICGPEGLERIDPDLPALAGRELDAIAARWPENLPAGIIHADLFPDNVLMRANTVTGLIDFYFACNDLLAYDLAVTHAAWCFGDEGRRFLPDISAALLAGYDSVRPIDAAEHAALPILACGAAMRFLATRSYDWLNTPDGALVTRKDPMAFARRLRFYADQANAGIFA